MEIQASVSGKGADSSNGSVRFDPLKQLPRAGLLLTGGQVYITWGSSCDIAPYHGWVMAYDSRTLRQTVVFNTSPDSTESGIWQSDMAPASDDAGDVYVATGNGTFDAASGGRDYGDSLLKLHLAGNNLAVRGLFTPPNQATMNSRDFDLGSGGPVLVPIAGGRRLVLVAGKDGRLQVLDSDRLEKGAVQVLPVGRGVYAAPAYWNGHVFISASEDELHDFAVVKGQLSDRPVASGTQRFPNPGSAPVVSANGTRNAIVWLIETKVWNDYTQAKHSVLHAYYATNVAREIYTSEQNISRDRAGPAVRFTLPTIANGRIYVGTKGEVDAYGLFDANH